MPRSRVMAGEFVAECLAENPLRRAPNLTGRGVEEVDAQLAAPSSPAPQRE